MSNAHTHPAPVGSETAINDDTAESDQIRSSPTADADRVPRVRDRMQRNICVVEEDDTVDEAARKLRDAQAYTAVVRDAEGRWTGLFGESEV